MDPALVVLIGVGGLLLVGLVAYLSWRAEQARIAEIRAWAGARGWHYVERDDSWEHRFPGAPFDSGHNRQCHKVLTGQHDGRQAVVMDFVYHTTETSTDANGHTRRREVKHWYGVVALAVGADTPELAVAPEGFLGRVVGRLLNSDIELESEDFNRAFTVRCEDRRFASDVLHPRMMELLLTHPDTAWRLAGGWLVTAERGTYSLPDVEGRLAFADRVLDAFPAFLRRQLGLPEVGA